MILTMKKIYHILHRIIAKTWYDINLQLTVIGITGSYGKTTTAYAVKNILASKFSTLMTDLNLDTNYNIPITLLKIKPWNEVLVLEYGVDHIGEMDKHLSLVKPKIAVLTGITSVHADEEHLGSLENIVKEKRKLIDALPSDGLAIFNYDDEIVRKIGSNYKGRKIFIGTKKEADIWASDIKIKTTGTTFKLNDSGCVRVNRTYQNDDKTEQKVIVETGLLGYPAVYSSLVAWAVGKELKVKEDEMLKSLKSLKQLRGRFSIEPGPLGTTLVNDSLRANFASTITGLKSFAQFPGRKTAVLGEMGEVGDMEEKVHREVGRQAAELKIDFLVGVGTLAKFIIDEAKKSGMKSSSLFWTENVNEAAEILKKILKEGDLLYLKASLLRHIERVIIILEGKDVNCTETVCHQYCDCRTCRLLNQSLK